MNDNQNGGDGAWLMVLSIILVVLVVTIPAFIAFKIFQRVRPSKRGGALESALVCVLFGFGGYWLLGGSLVGDDIFMNFVLILMPLAASVGFIYADFRGVLGIEEDQRQTIEPQTSYKNEPDYDDFADSAAAGDFGFDAGRFGAKPPPSQPDENAPRGYDKRHPDDAKFWAHADDPSNPPHIREAWFKKAVEREEARRKGKNPDNVAGLIEKD